MSEGLTTAELCRKLGITRKCLTENRRKGRIKTQPINPGSGLGRIGMRWSPDAVGEIFEALLKNAPNQSRSRIEGAIPP